MGIEYLSIRTATVRRPARKPVKSWNDAEMFSAPNLENIDLKKYFIKSGFVILPACCYYK